MERALIVGLDLNEYDMKLSLNELSNLAEAVDIKTVDTIIQKADKRNPATYIGSGKVLEIKQAIPVLDVSLVIFDDVLTPVQIKNLEAELDIQIMDRSFLILQIFAERAKTKESALEVALAQQKYLLPRLAGMTPSLSRQGGGYNAKGAGETKLELDRRHIEQTINKLEKDLKKIQQEKETSRKRRESNEIPVVSLVGYTNVGKSATMNNILKMFDADESKNVFEKNMLFATLSTFTRRIKPKQKPPFILTDTVGFVSRLPHELVASFESTLSEVKYSDLILHIADGSSSQFEMQFETTEEVLKQVGAKDIPQLYVFTKKDLIFGAMPVHYNHDLVISNKTGENLDKLVELIYRRVYGNQTYIDLTVPFSLGNVVSDLEENTEIISKTYTEFGNHFKVKLYEKQIPKYADFIKK